MVQPSTSIRHASLSKVARLTGLCQELDAGGVFDVKLVLDAMPQIKTMFTESSRWSMLLCGDFIRDRVRVSPAFSKRYQAVEY